MPGFFAGALQQAGRVGQGCAAAEHEVDVIVEGGERTDEIGVFAPVAVGDDFRGRVHLLDGAGHFLEDQRAGFER